jgi:hypothetical protein
MVARAAAVRRLWPGLRARLVTKRAPEEVATAMAEECTAEECTAVKPLRRGVTVRRLAAVLLLAGAGLALGGCVVAPAHPGYYARPYGYGPPPPYYRPRPYYRPYYW